MPHSARWEVCRFVLPMTRADSSLSIMAAASLFPGSSGLFPLSGMVRERPAEPPRAGNAPLRRIRIGAALEDALSIGGFPDGRIPLTGYIYTNIYESPRECKRDMLALTKGVAPMADEMGFRRAAPNRPARRGVTGERVWPVIRIREKKTELPDVPNSDSSVACDSMELLQMLQKRFQAPV